MKKRLILTFILILVFALSVSAYAISLDGEEIRNYLEEKIIPVIAGVVTSLIALIGTLKSIFSTLKQLKSSKESFDKTRNEIEVSSLAELEQISKKYDELKESVKNVPELEKHLLALNSQIGTLIVQLSNLSQLTAIGFCESAELVSSGKGRQIALLAEKNQVVAQNEEN